MAQFWHTLKEDGSKYRLTFMLDKKMLSLTLDDFRTIFHLPQATDNNHDSFVHLASEEIEKMVDEPKNVIDDSPIPRNDDQNIPSTRLEPRSDKESPKQREKGKIVEESRSTPSPTPIRSPRIQTDLVSSNTEKLQELMGRDGYLFEHLRVKFLSRKSFDTLTDHLQEVMVESLPTIVDKHIKE
ncbi:hypothetical protein Tco_1444226, partial [Tanacetum coccineum]